MGNFLRMEECPKCHIPNRKKTLARYEDGSAYCFYPCGHYEHGNLRSRLQLLQEVSKPTDKAIYLPEDSSPVIGYKARQWLSKYGIEDHEIRRNTLLYSEYRDMLIFPFFSTETVLLGWQGRYFGTQSIGRVRRYYSQGDLKTILHIINPTQITKKGVVLVEDCVSAIKCGRESSAIPIFGSHISKVLLGRLALLNPKKVWIWLDRDKAKEAVKFADKARLWYNDVSVVITDKDPKAYNTEEIKKHLDI